jgi:predicted nucleic acid-binding OB-fold protein
MHAHLQFAMADYLVSTLMIKIDDINNEANDEIAKVVINVIDANENLFIDITNPNSRSSGIGAHQDSR